MASLLTHSAFVPRAARAPLRARGCQSRRGVGSGVRVVRVVAQGTGRFIVGGNWKCNGTRDSVAALLVSLNAGKIVDNVDVVVAPPFLYIDQAMEALNGNFQVAAQSAWVEAALQDPSRQYNSQSGAFTGEISAEMLEAGQRGRLAQHHAPSDSAARQRDIAHAACCNGCTRHRIISKRAVRPLSPVTAQ